MRYFSTFSGIGGFELGIERAALSVWNGEASDSKPEASEPSMESTSESLRHNRYSADPEFRRNTRQVSCVGSSEIDKYASSVYEYHNPGVKNYGDITKINADELPDFDCLVGGFPCQAFSIAGKRRGFDDTRGTLFFDLARILRAKQPRLFVFENVKGLLSHDNGNTFKTIIATSDELGYDCQWQVLNSKNHGVAQNRERVFIIGHLRGTCRPKVLPYSSDNGEATNPATHKGAIVDLTLRADKGYRVRRDLRAGTIDANYYKGIANQERPGVIVGTLRTHKDGNGSREMLSGVSPTIPARAREDGSGQPIISNESKIRRLTPIECERLQGFPDDWTKRGSSGCNRCAGTSVIREAQSGMQPVQCPNCKPNYISDTQRYKMCGNAVTVNVIKDIFTKLLKEVGYE